MTSSANFCHATSALLEAAVVRGEEKDGRTVLPAEALGATCRDPAASLDIPDIAA
jgi:hypothetical protein